jgi:hypothetical protein
MSFVPFFHHCQKFVCATLGAQPDLVAFAISWSLAVRRPASPSICRGSISFAFRPFRLKRERVVDFFAAHECVQHERSAAPLNEIFHRDLDAASVPWFFGSFRRPQGFFWRSESAFQVRYARPWYPSRLPASRDAALVSLGESSKGKRGFTRWIEQTITLPEGLAAHQAF